MKGKKYVEIFRTVECYCVILNQAYYKWTLSEIIVSSVKEFGIRTYGILLPFYKIIGKKEQYSDDGIYTYVTYDWKEMTESGHAHPLQITTFD